MHIFLCTMCIPGAHGSQTWVSAPLGTVVRDGCEAPCVCWKSNSVLGKSNQHSQLQSHLSSPLYFPHLVNLNNKFLVMGLPAQRVFVFLPEAGCHCATQASLKLLSPCDPPVLAYQAAGTSHMLPCRPCISFELYQSSFSSVVLFATVSTTHGLQILLFWFFQEKSHSHFFYCSVMDPLGIIYRWLWATTHGAGN